MPRFYFNYFDGHNLIEDREGQELENVDQALEQAELHARDRLKELRRQGNTPCDETVEAISDAGVQVTVISLAWIVGDADC